MARAEGVGSSQLNAPTRAVLAGSLTGGPPRPLGRLLPPLALARVRAPLPRGGASPGAFLVRHRPPGRFPLNASHLTAPGVLSHGSPTCLPFPRLGLDRELPPWPFPVRYRPSPAIKGRQIPPGPPFVFTLGLASTHIAPGARESPVAVVKLLDLRRRRISGDSSAHLSGWA